MIVFDPLWELLKKRGIDKSELLNVVTPEVLAFMEENNNDEVWVDDIAKVCVFLNCRIQDVIVNIPDE